MGYEDHTCESCPHWDDINGCWADGETEGPFDMACPAYAGEDFDEVDEEYQEAIR